MKLWICSNLQEQEAGSLQSAYTFKDSLFHFVYKIFNVFLIEKYDIVITMKKVNTIFNGLSLIEG